MEPRERAELIKAATKDEWDKKPGTKLEKLKDSRRLVITKAPDYIYNEQGDIVGIDAWVQLFDDKGRELPIDPHRRIINPPTVPRSGIKDTETGELGRLGNPKKLREVTLDPVSAFYEAVWDSVESTPNEKGWRTRGTVTTVFGDTTDGYIESFNAVYATARTGGGTLTAVSATDSNILVGQANLAGFYCEEGFIGFDTSAINDSDVISSVVLDLWLVTDSSTTDFTCEARVFDWGATLTTADWISGASLSANTLVASISSSGIGATGAYKTFTSQAAFLTAPNLKTGITNLVLDSDRHVAANSPTNNENLGFDDANTAGTTQDPKLTITHAAPPPAMPFFQNFPNRIWRL